MTDKRHGIERATVTNEKQTDLSETREIVTDRGGTACFKQWEAAKERKIRTSLTNASLPRLGVSLEVLTRNGIAAWRNDPRRQTHSKLVPLATGDVARFMVGPGRGSPCRASGKL